MKSKLLGIINKAKSPSTGEIMAAVNRGDEKVDGAEVLEKPYQSQAQARYVHAKAGEGEQWAKKFVADSHGQKAGNLPEKVEKAGAVDPGRVVTFDKPIVEAWQPKGKPIKAKEAPRVIPGRQSFSGVPDPIASPESLHMEGHDKWNLFVDHSATQPEGAEHARMVAVKAQEANHHLNSALKLGGGNIGVIKPLYQASQRMYQARVNGEDPTPHQQAFDEAAAALPYPSKAGEITKHVHHLNEKMTMFRKALANAGIPAEHHAEIYNSAVNWHPSTPSPTTLGAPEAKPGVPKKKKELTGKGQMKSEYKKKMVIRRAGDAPEKAEKSLNKSMSIVKKLEKAMPSPVEDKQEAGESSPSVERTMEAPKEGKTRPFIGIKEAFKAIKARHEDFKKKVKQDRCDEDADATAIYSMTDSDVKKNLNEDTESLEKSKPSYKTLRSAKLPDGSKVNVYGNNGYERISNGPHRGRYLHSVLAEAKLGRKLHKDEEIDHKNGDRKANHAENLRLTTTSAHASHTNTQRAQQGGFTGEKRYMHSREYTEGKPESMKKGIEDYEMGELDEARKMSQTTTHKQSPQYKGAIKGIVDRMKARRAADALSSHEVAMDISKERREGKKEDPKGTGAPAWQNPMRKSSLPEKVKKGEDLKQ